MSVYMLTCELCGRRGTRGFALLRGVDYGATGAQVICASYAACERRQRRLVAR